jgi:Listeria/Bacterioides repeat
MKHIYTFKQFIQKPLLVALALLAMSSNAWGATLTAKTSVASGKGTAKVEIIDGYGFTQQTGTATSTTVVTKTFSMSAVRWAKSKFTATAATGYTFDAWYTNTACTSGKQTANPYETSQSKNKARTDAYYAKFIPNTYTIKFNGNGGSGSMSEHTCTYDVAWTLTANSFTKEGYTFNGWNTKADGTGNSFANQASVTNITSTNGAVINLYAQWKANTYYVQFNGNGNSSGSMSKQTLTYDKSATLTANAFARSFTVTYDTDGGTYAKASETATYSFSGWAESATGEKKYNNQASVKNLTSTNGATVNLYALWTGGTITLQKATKEGKVFVGWYLGDTYIGSKDANYNPTANVTLKAHWADIASPNYTWNGAESKTYLVGDPALDLNTLWVSNNDEDTKTYTLVSFTPSGTNNTGATAPTLTGSTLTLGQAGEVKLKVTQPASEYFYAGEAELTLTINKHENTILVKGVEHYRKEIEINSYDNLFTFTATNTDYANCPINVEQIAGQNIATYYPDQKAIYSGNMSGEAVWQVTQAENYYYEAGESTLAIDVRLAAEVVCYVIDDASEHSFATGITDFSGHFDTPIAVSEPVKSLSFSAKKDLLGANYFVAQYSTDNGNSWRDLVSPELSDSYQDFGPYNLPVHNITHIRFGAKTGGTFSKYYKNIKLSRFTYLNLSAETLTFDKTNNNAPLYCGDAVTKTFTIDWSMPQNGTQINISSTNSKFTVSQAKISNTGCNDGSNTITVTYSSDVAGTFDGKIIINNEVFYKEITVTGTTIKRDQAISWTQEQNYITTNDITLNASASSELNPTYTVVSGDDVATVDENTGVVTILKAGDVTFRASQVGDGCYNAAEPVDREFHIDLTPATLVFDNGTVVVSEQANTIELDLTTLITSRSDEGAITYEITSSNAANATLDGDQFSAVVIGDYTLRASKEETNYYTATTAEFVVTVVEGVIFIGSENTNWGDGTNWSSGEVPTEFDRVIINADVTLSSDVEVTGLTVNEGKTLTIADGAVLTIGAGNSLSRETYGNIIVEAGGQLILGNGAVNVNDFTLYSNFQNEQPKSGQVSNPLQLTTHGEAYFILDLDPSGSASYGWYSFTVPFPVDAMQGVYRLDNGNWVKAVNEVNYAIMDYHEDLRAQGKYGWKKYRSILQPGTGYLMTVENALNTYRFTKTQDGNFNTAMTQTLNVTDGDEKDKGWNSIGNGTTSYVTYASTPRYAQLYNHSTNAYDIELTTGNALVVGAAYFVQATTNNSTITMQDASDATTGLLRAPQRDTESDVCFVNLSLSVNGKSSDKLFVTCDDNAATTYTIGKDVMKMGATTGVSVARIWANAKGTTLGAADVAYNGNEAIIPLGIYAPKDGEYTLSLNSNPMEDVYLTRNGVIVWNLTMSDYTFSLNAGSDTSYALQVVRRVQNTATGVDAIDNDKRGTDFVEKMIVNGQLFILRDGILYDAQGKKVSTL